MCYEALSLQKRGQSRCAIHPKSERNDKKNISGAFGLRDFRGGCMPLWSAISYFV